MSARSVIAAYAEERSRPVDSSACGSRLVSVSPGMTFDSRNHGRPSASTIRSTRDRCRRPIDPCASTASRPAAAAAAGIDAGGRVEPGLARGVPLRRSRRTRSAARSRPPAAPPDRRRCRSRRRRSRCRAIRCSISASSAYVKASIMARGSWSAVSTTVTPCAEPPRAGLTTRPRSWNRGSCRWRCGRRSPGTPLACRVIGGGRATARASRRCASRSACPRPAGRAAPRLPT